MWIYKDKEINCHEDLNPTCTDIVYLITYCDGTRYFGKKAVRAFRKKPPLKGKKRARRLLTNLPFLKYEGSAENETTAGISKKEILYQCSTRKASTYLETALLFYYNAIFDPQYINKNINGKFFDNDLDGLIEE